MHLTFDCRRAWRRFTGPVYGMADVRRDVTSETLAALIAAVDEYAIYMLDAVGGIVTWNAGARRIKGYTDDEVIGRHFSLFFTNDDISAGKPQLLLAEAALVGHTADEGWRVRRDGTRFWANVAMSALFDDTGNVIGYIKVTRDDTDRQTAQRQAEELRLLRDRDRLARGINGTVINRIFSAGLVIEGLRTLIRDETMGERIDLAVSELDLAINELRSIVLEREDPPPLD